MGKYTVETMIKALHSTQGKITLAAKLVSCSYNTLRSYIEKYPEICKVYEQYNSFDIHQIELSNHRELITGYSEKELTDWTLFNIDQFCQFFSIPKPKRVIRECQIPMGRLDMLLCYSGNRYSIVEIKTSHGTQASVLNQEVCRAIGQLLYYRESFSDFRGIDKENIDMLFVSDYRIDKYQRQILNLMGIKHYNLYTLIKDEVVCSQPRLL